MRILFAMQSPDYVRFYDTAIESLAARGHEVVLAVSKVNEVKGVSLAAIAAANERIADAGRLPKRKDLWSAFAHGVRGTMDFVRYLHPRYAGAPVLRARMKGKVLPRPLYFLDRFRSLSSRAVGRFLRLLIAMERAVPIEPGTARFLAKRQIDLVLVTPLVDAASPLVEVVKAAHAAAVPVGVCIASWDNLTNKGHLRVVPEAVMVWNEVQRDEAIELHDIPDANIVVTGAQVFDRWFDCKPTVDRSTFCNKVGLPGDRPIVLFVGSSSFISKVGDDVELVRDWIRSLRRSDDATLRNAAVLFRPHPYYYRHWVDVDLSDLGPAAVWPRDYTTIVDPRNREDYFNTLYHCAAVVGINTSAMIEAAILGKPVHSILLPEFAGTQEGTLHFRYLMPENGGFLWIASSLEEHEQQLRRTLSGNYDRERTARFVERFLRPLGIDRACTPILVAAVEKLGEVVREPAVRSLAARLGAVVMTPVALLGKVAEARRKGKKLSRKALLGT